MTRSIRLTAMAAMFALVGCGGPVGDPQKSASKALGVEGGQVAAPNGISVTIPSGALRKSTVITLAPASADQARPINPSVGEMYEFGPEGQTFDVPVKVKLEVDLTRLPAGYSIADVIVQRAPVGSTAFEILPTRIVDTTHVEADTLHFSVFVPTLDAARGGGSDGGTDGGVDGGVDDGGVTCSERCVAGNDAGADCECSRVCGQETFEIQCSGSSPLGCACVRNGAQVGFVSTSVCPGVGDIERLCGFSSDGGIDGGFPDAGTDGGVRPDGGVVDGGFPDAGTDGGFPDGGTDGGFPDAGTDGGVRPDGGVVDGGFPDAGSDGGVVDGGFPDAGVDGGFPDAGSDGGFPTDGGSDAGFPDAGSDGGVGDAGTDGGAIDAGTPDAGRDGGP